MVFCRLSTIQTANHSCQEKNTVHEKIFYLKPESVSFAEDARHQERNRILILQVLYNTVNLFQLFFLIKVPPEFAFSYPYRGKIELDLTKDLV